MGIFNLLLEAKILNNVGHHKLKIVNATTMALVLEAKTSTHNKLLGMEWDINSWVTRSALDSTQLANCSKEPQHPISIQAT